MPTYTYNQDTTKTAQSYNITEREVMFCYLIASGADRGDAYYCLFDHGIKNSGTNEQARTKANELLKNKPGMKVLIQRMKDRKKINDAQARNQVQAETEHNEANVLNDEDVKKFSDKSYIIAQLSSVCRNLTGKEKAQVLMQIADLQRMKNEETKEKEEVRRFYLPYVSRCRGCKVLQLVSGVLEGEKPGEKEG